MSITVLRNFYFTIVNINKGMFMSSPIRRSENFKKDGSQKNSWYLRELSFIRKV